MYNIFLINYFAIESQEKDCIILFEKIDTRGVKN